MMNVSRLAKTADSRLKLMSSGKQKQLSCQIKVKFQDHLPSQYFDFYLHTTWTIYYSTSYFPAFLCSAAHLWEHIIYISVRLGEESPPSG